MDDNLFVLTQMIIEDSVNTSFNFILLFFFVPFPESPPPPYFLSRSDEHKPLGEFGKCATTLRLSE